ncbi:MAG: DUF393 domain-containing protein [Saprospiraceae bacterium]|nr:DUF393 domain-containing protein [Saprospiraceae bacterium]
MSGPERLKLIYDGECSLCSRFCNWVRKADKQGKIEIFTLNEFRKAGIGPDQSYSTEELPDSILLIKENQWLFASDAIIQLGLVLGGIYKVFGAGLVIPKMIRDFLYQLVAKNRYRWFNKKQHCEIKDQS